MRELFPESFPMEQRVVDQLWADAIIVFDTNVLLDIHAWKKEQAEWFLSQCETRLAGRLWLPNQVVREFTRGRTIRLHERLGNIDAAIKELSSEGGAIWPRIAGKLGNARVDVDQTSFPDLQGPLDEWLKPKLALLNEEKEELKQRELLENDYIFERMESLYRDRVGPAYPFSQERSLYEEAGKRFSGLTPPGFGDQQPQNSKKEEYRRYGDFFIWRQIIDHANSQTVKGVIFVTNDSEKRDWLIGDKKKSPHPELLREFRMSVPNKSLWIYNFKDFLYFAEQHKAIVGQADYERAVREAQRDAEERKRQNREEQALHRRLEDYEIVLKVMNSLDQASASALNNSLVDEVNRRFSVISKLDHMLQNSSISQIDNEMLYERLMPYVFQAIPETPLYTALDKAHQLLATGNPQRSDADSPSPLHDSDPFLRPAIAPGLEPKTEQEGQLDGSDEGLTSSGDENAEPGRD